MGKQPQQIKRNTLSMDDERSRDLAFGNSLLSQFTTYFNNLYQVREEYRLNTEYRAGKQLQRRVKRRKGEKIQQELIIDGKVTYNDLISHSDREMTEAEDLEDRGYTPHIENHIAHVLNSLEGNLRANMALFDVVGLDEESDAFARDMQMRLELTHRTNQVEELDAVSTRDLLAGNVMIQRWKWDFDSNSDRYEAIGERIPLSRVAWNPDMRDVHTLRDLTFFGVSHHLPIEVLLETYAVNSDGVLDKDKLRILKEIYPHEEDDHDGVEFDGTYYGYDAYMNTDASNMWHGSHSVRAISGDFGRSTADVYDIWRKERRDVFRVRDPETGEIIPTFASAEEIEELNEHIEAHNKAEEKAFRDSLDLLRFTTSEEYANEVRASIETTYKPRKKFEKFGKRIEMRWVNYHIATDGTILSRQDNSTGVQSPSYIMEFLNVDDGMFANFSTVLRDINDDINTVLSKIERQIEIASLLFLEYDVDSIPEDEFGSRSNYEAYIRNQLRKGVSIIPFSSIAADISEGNKAQPVKVHSLTLNNLGVLDTYRAQKEMLIEKLTGITESLQGQEPDAGTPAALYQMQIQQGSYATSFITAKVNSFRRKRNMYLMQLIQENEVDDVQIDYAEDDKNKKGMRVFNADKARDLRFNITQSATAKNATGRFRSEQVLWQLVSNGMITPEEFFAETQIPEIKRIENSRKQKQAENENAMIEQGMTADTMQSANQAPQMPPQMPQNIQQPILQA